MTVIKNILKFVFLIGITYISIASIAAFVQEVLIEQILYPAIPEDFSYYD